LASFVLAPGFFLAAALRAGVRRTGAALRADDFRDALLTAFFLRATALRPAFFFADFFLALAI